MLLFLHCCCVYLYSVQEAYVTVVAACHTEKTTRLISLSEYNGAIVRLYIVLWLDWWTLLGHRFILFVYFWVSMFVDDGSFTHTQCVAMGLIWSTNSVWQICLYEQCVSVSLIFSMNNASRSVCISMVNVTVGAIFFCEQCVTISFSIDSMSHPGWSVCLNNMSESVWSMNSVSQSLYLPKDTVSQAVYLWTKCHNQFDPSLTSACQSVPSFCRVCPVLSVSGLVSVSVSCACPSDSDGLSDYVSLSYPSLSVCEENILSFQ